VTLGHEFSGVIEEVGAGVEGIEVGERVVVQPIIYDGTCGACTEGFINCCDKNGFVGLSGKCSGGRVDCLPILKPRLGGWIVRSCGSSSGVRI
jgi:threonine dehydrogenase-like Zn-dependent dehydrogenase